VLVSAEVSVLVGPPPELSFALVDPDSDDPSPTVPDSPVPVESPSEEVVEVPPADCPVSRAAHATRTASVRRKEILMRSLPMPDDIRKWGRSILLGACKARPQRR
jgi:hypothetical protein